MPSSEFPGQSAGLSFPTGGARDSEEAHLHGAALAWGGAMQPACIHLC